MSELTSPPEEIVKCEDCEHWRACPECGHEGFCIENRMLIDKEHTWISMRFKEK